MATLDELSVLENRYSTLNSVVNGHTTEIHNLDTRLDTAESKLNNHEERIKTLEVKVEDHERRLQLIENSHTSEIIGIEAGSILVQVLHLFSYHTVPEKE